jgi:hypothetical protein
VNLPRNAAPVRIQEGGVSESKWSNIPILLIPFIHLGTEFLMHRHPMRAVSGLCGKAKSTDDPQ